MFPPYSLSNGLLVIPGFVTSCCTLVIFLFSGSSRLCDSRHPLHLYVSHLSVYISSLHFCFLVKIICGSVTSLVISRRFPFQLCLSFPSVCPYGCLGLCLVCVCVFVSFLILIVSCPMCLLSFAILGLLVGFCPPGVFTCPYLMWVFKSSVFFVVASFYGTVCASVFP